MGRECLSGLTEFKDLGTCLFQFTLVGSELLIQLKNVVFVVFIGSDELSDFEFVLRVKV